MSNETLMTTDAEQPNVGEEVEQQTEQPATGADSAGQQQAQEQEAEGQKQPAAGAEEAKPEGAPEQYKFANSEDFDQDILGQFSDVAKELNLSQEAAQKVLDKMAPAIESRQAEQLQAVREQWAAEAKADAEYGGDKLDENLSAAKRALDAYATPELRTLLNDSGLGNHPEVIRFMVRAGKAISEDKFVTGGRGTNQPTDIKRLYPNSNMN